MKPSSPVTFRASPMLLLVWLLSVAAVTLFPFDFHVSPERLDNALEDFLGNEGYSAREIVPNVLMFVPLGAFAHQYWRRRLVGVPLVVLAGTAGLLLSSTVECLQLFLPRRDPNVSDLLANTTGAIAGALAHRALAMRADAWILRLRTRGARPMLVGLVVAFTLVALVMSGALQLRTRLSGWNADYPLLVGNEPTGDRPWRGRIVEFELTDAPTPLGAVQRFSRGGSADLPGTLVAAFNFSGRPPYKDAAGNLPVLDWTERPGEDTEGVRLTGQSWLRTEGPASAIARQLGQSNAFTLRVVCATDDVNQRGPARIISNSLDTGRRNLTLGQDGRDLVFRFRTPLTGTNGFRPQIVLPGVFSSDRLREILVTYDGTTLFAAVADSAHIQRTDLTPGASLALRITNLRVRADELEILSVVYLVGLFLPPAILLRFMERTMRGRLVFGVLWLGAFAGLLEGTLVLTSGRSFDWRNVATTVLVGAVVLTVAVVTRTGVGQQGRRVLTTEA